MRFDFKAFVSSSLIALATACGAPHDNASIVAADRPVQPLAGRFGAPDVLDALNSTGANSRLRLRQGVTDAQLDAALDALDGKIRIDPTAARLRLDDTFGRGLTASQLAGFSTLQSGLDARLREEAVKLAPGTRQIVPGDGRTTAVGEGFDGLVIGPGGGLNRADEVESGAADTSVNPEHRVGDGRWSWRLSFKWWGVRLGVNHNFLNYLCHNTEWMLSKAGLPGWVKIVIRPLGCLLHAADGGADGASISITWAGVFWYTP